jgi:hypothetical protein
MSYAPTCPRCNSPLSSNIKAPGSPAFCGRCGASNPLQPSPFAAGNASLPPANPYAAPGMANPFADQFAPNYHQPSYDPGSIRQIAKAKVQGPAILLMVSGGALVLAAIGFVVVGIGSMLQENDQEAIVVGVLLSGMSVICLAASVVLAIAGYRMRALRSYGLALTATILTIGVGFMICIPAALVGIWPLIVLLDSQVKQGFTIPPQAGEI